jgi:anti-anti-sigma factor
MQVKVTKLGAAVFLIPDGAITADQMAPLRESVLSTRTNGHGSLVIDMKRVPYIDSCGLELLFDLGTELGRSGGSLRLVNLNSLCREIMVITRLDQLIPMYDNIESAAGRLM